MTLRNRIDPYGRLHAVDARGAWMGNRGVLHDDARRIVAAWRSPRWISCVLEFRGRRRDVFAPHRYSELFFLDEATSLAAGHRPCAECRKERFREFGAAFAAGRSRGTAARPPRADDIDRVLHGERVERGGGKKTYPAAWSALPDGTIFDHDGRPHLKWGGASLPWTFAGYGEPVRIPASARVRVLTPRSIVRAIRAGFVPQVDVSVDDGRPAADVPRGHSTSARRRIPSRMSSSRIRG